MKWYDKILSLKKGMEFREFLNEFTNQASDDISTNEKLTLL